MRQAGWHRRKECPVPAKELGWDFFMRRGAQMKLLLMQRAPRAASRGR